MPAGDAGVKVGFGEQAEGKRKRQSKIACSSYLFDCRFLLPIERIRLSLLRFWLSFRVVLV